MATNVRRRETIAWTGRPMARMVMRAVSRMMARASGLVRSDILAILVLSIE
jgi:hypothetical protein